MPSSADSLAAAVEALFPESDRLFRVSSIPQRKLANAREVHAAHLPADEPVLLLYDDTLWGSAKDGFLLTAQRLCWKNLMENPSHLLLADLVPGMARPEEDKVVLAGGSIALVMEDTLAEPLAALLEQIATRQVQVRRLPPPGGPLAGSLRALFVARLAGSPRIHVPPGLDPNKEALARTTHGLPSAATEPILMLYDDTLFGSAEEGMVATPKGLYWKDIGEDSAFRPWADIDPERVRPYKSGILLGTTKISCICADELTQALAETLAEAARIALAGGAPEPAPEPAGMVRCDWCGNRSPLELHRCPSCGAPT